MTPLQPRRALVTGGTDGIGKFTALGLARMGFDVIIVGRSAAKGTAVLETIRAMFPDRHSHFIPADLSRMAEVRRVAAAVRAQVSRLDVLIHSAGVIHMQRRVTDEGLEATFATDYLSRYLLTVLLFDLLEAAAPARVVNIAAAGMNFGAIQFDDLQGERHFNGMTALGQAQFANDVFTIELARRTFGRGVSALVMHPGAVDTDIRREFPRWLNGVLSVIARPFAMTPERGAAAPLALATDSQYAGITGALFNRTKRLTPSAKVSDPELGQRLWATSAALTGAELPQTITPLSHTK